MEVLRKKEGDQTKNSKCYDILSLPKSKDLFHPTVKIGREYQSGFGKSPEIPHHLK